MSESETLSPLRGRVPDRGSLTRQSPENKLPTSADDFRAQANAAKQAAGESKSLKESRRHRKRGKALNDMADNEDWLAGKPAANAKQ